MQLFSKVLGTTSSPMALRVGFQSQPQIREPGTTQLPPQHNPTLWSSWQPLQQARQGLPTQEGPGPYCASRIKTSSLTHAVNNREFAKPGELDYFVPLIPTSGGSVIILPTDLSTAHFYPTLDTRHQAEVSGRVCSTTLQLGHPCTSWGLLQTQSQHTHTELCLLQGSTQETQTCRDTNSCSSLP